MKTHVLLQRNRRIYQRHQIREKLNQADLAIEQGISVPRICQQLAISEQTYFRWRKKYGGVIEKSENLILSQGKSAD